MANPVVVPLEKSPGFSSASFQGTNVISLAPLNRGVPIGAIVPIPPGCRRLSLRAYDPATGDPIAVWYGLTSRKAQEISGIQLAYGPDGGVTIESLPPESGIDLDRLSDGAAVAVVVAGDTTTAVIAVQAEGSCRREPIPVRS